MLKSRVLIALYHCFTSNRIARSAPPLVSTYLFSTINTMCHTFERLAYTVIRVPEVKLPEVVKKFKDVIFEVEL